MEKSKEIVLVVDDEPRNVRIIQKAISEKYSIAIAESGEIALEKIDKLSPAIILLDIMMPGIDGYEVCRRVREDPKQQLTKIILVSGKAMVDERLKGYEVGANDYVTKPFVREELMAKVKVFLDLYRAEKQLMEINESLEQEVQARTVQLVKAEKMAFIGMHSAEIVHNLKNPLSIMIGYLRILQKKDPDNKYAPQIMSAAEKLEMIIRSILDSTKMINEDSRKLININGMINSELEVLRIDRLHKYDIETRLELGEVPDVYGVPIHIAQILGNLFSNAGDAMRGSEKKVMTVKTYLDNNFVKIRISDTGVGIAPENIGRIFEPLFSTKSSVIDGPVGTGLGLAYCKRMLEGYGGTINIESEVGRGTSVEIGIPYGKDVNEQQAA